MKRFTSLPLSLYRIQPRMPVVLRDFGAKKSLSYDLRTVGGIVHPVTGSTYTGPNGMSLRPSTPKMHEILRSFKGNPTVYRMHEGMSLPDGLVILHERTDHYSLQVLARGPSLTAGGCVHALR